MSQPDLNKTIDKIENALHELSLNPKGGWTELMKMWGTPYYGNIPGVLRKRGIAEPEGTGLKWVGDKPTRTLAGIVYEEAKEASQGVRSKFKSKNGETKPEPATTKLAAQKRVNEILNTQGMSPKEYMAYSADKEIKGPSLQDDASHEILVRVGDNHFRQFPSDGLLTRALAVMEKAMRHQVADPVAFTLDVLKDERI